MLFRWLMGNKLAELKSQNAWLEAEIRLLRAQRNRLRDEVNQMHVAAVGRVRAVTNVERASATCASDYLVAGCDQGRRSTAHTAAFAAPYGPYRIEQSGHPVHWHIRDTRTGFVHFRTYKSQAEAAIQVRDWESVRSYKSPPTRIGSTGTFTSNQQFWKGAQL